MEQFYVDTEKAMADSDSKHKLQEVLMQKFELKQTKETSKAWLLEQVREIKDEILLIEFAEAFTFHLGFVHPLQDVVLHHCLSLSSVCCFPVSGGSLLPCYDTFPSSAWSSS